jgi:hypothetical protein
MFFFCLQKFNQSEKRFKKILSDWLIFAFFVFDQNLKISLNMGLKFCIEAPEFIADNNLMK